MFTRDQWTNLRTSIDSFLATEYDKVSFHGKCWPTFCYSSAKHWYFQNIPGKESAFSQTTPSNQPTTKQIQAVKAKT